MKSALLRNLILALSSLALMTGCDVTLGGKVKDRITFVTTSTKNGRTVEIAQIDQSLKTVITMENEKGEVVDDTKELQDYKAVRPDIAKQLGLVAPRIAYSVLVRVVLEDGKKDMMDLGGWYVVPPAPKPEPKPSPGE